MVKVGDIFASYYDERHNRMIVSAFYKVTKMSTENDNIWLVRIGMDNKTRQPQPEHVLSKPFLRTLINDQKVQITKLPAWLVKDIDEMSIDFQTPLVAKVGQIYEWKNPYTKMFERYVITSSTIGSYNVIKVNGDVDFFTTKNIQQSHFIEEYPTWIEAINSEDFVNIN